MWSILVRLAQHIFVITTGFAALLHSTWSLATLFNGVEPHQLTADWFAWVVPAFLIAFSFDVGQIAISVELRNGERTRAKYVAFAVLAVSTYLMQWLYMVAHVPMINFGTGVAAQHTAVASTIRDFFIWIVPGMLPLSTVLYTFSYAQPKRARPVAKPVQYSAAPVQPRASEVQITPMQNALATPDQPAIQPPENFVALPEGSVFPIACPDCEWNATYATKRAATNALTAHRRHHHPELQSANGRH